VSDHLGWPVRAITCREGEGDGKSVSGDGSGERETEVPAGYLDHLEELESGMDVVNDAFTEIGEAAKAFTPEIERATETIDEAREAQSPAAMRQSARIAARMTADAMSRYANRVTPQREMAQERWRLVDTALAGVLDWQVNHVDPESKVELADSLLVLVRTAKATEELQPVLESFRTSIRGSYGFDRGLNKQIDAITRELDAVSRLVAEVAATLSRAAQFRNRLVHGSGSSSDGEGTP